MNTNVNMYPSKSVRYLGTVQCVLYAFTALWALIDIGSFMEVTGLKTDIWLVKTVAFLLLSTSATLAFALYSENFTPPVAALAMMNAGSLAAIDIYYVINETIPRVYLIDAGIEVVYFVAWAVALWSVYSKRIPSNVRESIHYPDATTTSYKPVR